MNDIGYAGIVTSTIAERKKSAFWIWLAAPEFQGQATGIIRSLVDRIVVAI